MAISGGWGDGGWESLAQNIDDIGNDVQRKAEALHDVLMQSMRVISRAKARQSRGIDMSAEEECLNDALVSYFEAFGARLKRNKFQRLR